MAIQTLHENIPLASIGTGLGQGLSMLTQHKVNELTSKKRAKEWESIGLPSNLANFLVNQPEKIQMEFLDRLEGLNIGGRQQQAQPVSGQSVTGQPVSSSMQQSGMQPAMAQQQGMQQEAQPSSNLILGPGKQERMHREKLELKRELADRQETKDIRNKIIEDKKTARQELHDLNRMDELNKSGKLDTPGYIEFLDRSGLNIASLKSPESEEFQKIEKGFLKNIGNYFKGSISNNEINQFLQTIPTLSNSPEGRNRVIAMLKLAARGKFEYFNAMREVIAENRGKPPFDLQEKIENKVDSKIEALAKAFKSDLSKPVPKGQNRLITALQAGTGSVVGIPGALIGGAGKLISKLV